MKKKLMTASAMLAALLAVPVSYADALDIVNGGFDSGTEASAVIAGWTDTQAGTPGFWLEANNTPGGSLDAASPQAGSLFLTANRLVGGAGSQPVSSTLTQTINLSAANLALVAGGSALLNLDFYYHDEDPLDNSSVTVIFLDSGAAELGSITTGTLAAGDYSTSEWTAASLDSAVAMDVLTAAVRIDITTWRTGGSATNIQFDSFSGSVIPEPATLGLIGAVGAGLLFIRRRFMM